MNEQMTRQKAAKIIETRIGISSPEQSEALKFTLQVLNDPVNYLDQFELLKAYWKLQGQYDIADMELELGCNADYYAETFGTDETPVTQDELEQMAKILRKLLDSDADAAWSSCRSCAAETVLKRRNKNNLNGGAE